MTRRPKVSKAQQQAAAMEAVAMEAKRAEREVLGLVLLNNAVWPDTVELEPSDFVADRAHCTIFTCMRKLHAAGRAIDEDSIASELGDQLLGRVGGRTYLSVLADGLAARQSIAVQVERVRRNALRCSIAKELEAVTEQVHGGADVAELLTRIDALQATASASVPASPGENVSTATLLEEVTSLIRRFVILSPSQALAVALWTLHTHAMAAAPITPYLSITSAEKESGKTRLLEVEELVVANPWLTGRVTAACLIRKIDAHKPTLLLDESDAAFNSDKEYAEALRGVLNTGHRRGGQASCCIGQGANITFKDFQTFGAKSIAGIGALPDTVGARSIPIRLKRKHAKEVIERFRWRDAKAETKPLHARLRTWAARNLAVLREARPELPEILSDRQQDGAEPLLAIADLAGESWGAKARAALIELWGGQQDDSVRVRLLSDIKSLFDTKEATKLPSVELVEGLAAVEGSPWPEWKHDKPITAIGLARLLKAFEISPKPIRIGETVSKGYDQEQFADVWARYLPSEPLQRLQANVYAGAGPISIALQPPAVTVGKSEESPMFTRVHYCPN